MVLVTGGARGITAAVATAPGRGHRVPPGAGRVARPAPATRTPAWPTPPTPRRCARPSLAQAGEVDRPRRDRGGASAARWPTARSGPPSPGWTRPGSRSSTTRSTSATPPPSTALVDDVVEPPRPPRRRHPRRRGPRRPPPGGQDPRGLRPGVRHQGRPGRGPAGRVPETTRFVVLFGQHQRRVRQPRPGRLRRRQRRPRPPGRRGQPPRTCRVVAVDWGPWAGGGMVSPELEREYARPGHRPGRPRRGRGCRCWPSWPAGDGPSQVVVMRATPAGPGPGRRRPPLAARCGACPVPRPARSCAHAAEPRSWRARAPASTVRHSASDGRRGRVSEAEGIAIVGHGRPVPRLAHHRRLLAQRAGRRRRHLRRARHPVGPALLRPRAHRRRRVLLPAGRLRRRRGRVRPHRLRHHAGGRGRRRARPAAGPRRRRPPPWPTPATPTSGPRPSASGSSWARGATSTRPAPGSTSGCGRPTSW